MAGKFERSPVSGAYSDLYANGDSRISVTYSEMLRGVVAGGAALKGTKVNANFKTASEWNLLNGGLQVGAFGAEFSIVSDRKEWQYKVSAGAGLFGEISYSASKGWGLSGYGSYGLGFYGGFAGFGIGGGIETKYEKGKASAEGDLNFGIMGLSAKTEVSVFSTFKRTVQGWLNPIDGQLYPQDGSGPAKCFIGSTLIKMQSGEDKPISEIRVGDEVLAFDPSEDLGRGALAPKRVTRLFHNVTRELVKLIWAEDGEQRELICTPGHHFLAPDGNFPPIADIIINDRAEIVLSTGNLVTVFVERLYLDEKNSALFQATAISEFGDEPADEGWQTFNFEVEDFHTYVASGIRVHNISAAWAHESILAGVTAIQAAAVAKVPLDYALSLGRASMGVEDPTYGRGSDLVGYTSAGRAISIDRVSFENFLKNNGGDNASAKSRAVGAAIGATKNGYSRSDALAVAYNEAQKYGVNTDGAFDSYARRSIAKSTGSSGKGGGDSVHTTTSKSTSLSGSSSAGTKTSSRPTSSVPVPSSAPRGNSSSGSSGKGGGGDSSANTKSNSKSNSGSKKDSGGRSGKPVLLDLNGDGFSITDRSEANLYLDIGNTGYKHRTSWVGAGDGVLMIDADGDGKISDRKEIVFTDWDPSAGTDIQALRQVFDTNGNGLLDSGDSRWSQFKVMVTNADGTISQKSLSELGIQSVNLSVDETKIAFDGGSSIDGQTVFTRTDGTTGVAATATLVHDIEGYVVTDALSTDASGNVTVVNRAHNADGKLASVTTTVTSSDGRNVTKSFDDDGDGVVDRVLTDITVLEANGTKVKTETERDSGGVLNWSRTTRTSADGKTVTVDRDETGGGYTTQRETRVLASNNRFTITISQLASDGSVISKSVDTLESDKLTRSVSLDRDGNGSFERKNEHRTIKRADGSRLERESVFAGTGALLYRKETDISVNNLSRVEKIDIDGDGTFDIVSSSATTKNAAGDTIVTETAKARNGSVSGKTTTTVSQSGLSKRVQSDLDGDNVFDREISEQTVINADQSKTRTQTTKTGSGVLLAQTVEQRAADGLVGSISRDINGDGTIDQLVTVVKNGNGVIVETSKAFTADGSLVTQVVKTTSADGLATTTQKDTLGRNVFDEIVVDTVSKNTDGGSTHSLERRDQNQKLISRTTEITSQDGLSVSSMIDVDGDGRVDAVTRTVTTVAADASQTIVTEQKSGDGTILSKDVREISANRRVTSLYRDADGDGHSDYVEMTTIAADGSKTIEARNLSNTDTLLKKSIVTKSANGLLVQQTVDEDGDGDIDFVKTDITTLPSDGSQIRTLETKAQNGTLLTREVSTVSANGTTITTTVDQNGDGNVDQSKTSLTKIEANGVKSVSEITKAGTTTVATTEVRTSANGLVIETIQDLDGNGTVDVKSQTSKVFSSNGSITETESTTAGNGNLLTKIIKTTAANGMQIVTTVDDDGDNFVDLRSEEVLSSAGVKTSTVSELGAAGQVLSRSIKTVDRSGANLTQTFDRNGDGVVDLTRKVSVTIADDASKTTVQSQYTGTSTLVEQETTKESANGLSKSVTYTDASARTIRTVQQIQEVLQSGGTKTSTTITKADGLLESKSSTEVSANKRNSISTKDVNGNGVIDQKIVASLADNGVLSEVYTDYQADGTTVARQKSVETSANGLVKTIIYDGDGNGVGERRVTETSELGQDGRVVKTIEYASYTNNTWVVQAREEVVTTADDLSRTSRWNDSGAAGWNITRTQITQLSADGSKTEVDTWRKADQKVHLTETTVSANGLTETTRVDTNGDGAFDYTKIDQKTLNTDGSSTRTITTTDAHGRPVSSVTETVSADGYTTTVNDVSGISGIDSTATVIVSRQLADGSSTEITTVKNASGKLIERVEKHTSDDKRRTTTWHDSNGDGVNDQQEDVHQTLDGRVLTTITNYGTNSAVLNRTTISLSADKLSKTTDFDLDGDSIYEVRRIQKNDYFADGSREVTTTETNISTGKLISKIRSRTSADGMTFIEETDLNGDGVVDQTVTETALASGERVTRVTNNAVARASSEKRVGEAYWSDAIPSVSETTTDPSGETKRVRIDQDGDGYFEVTMLTSILPDGSEYTQITETNLNGSIKSKGIYRTTHDGRTTVLERDSNNDGFFEYREVSVRHSNGEVTQTAVTSSQTSSATQVRVTEVNALGKLVNQTFAGQAGSQTYSWANYTGITTLSESGDADDIDILLLESNSSIYSFTHQGNDLIISRGAAQLIVKDHFVSNRMGLERISFAKGTEIWSRDRIEAEAWYRGTDGEDTLEVIAGDNRLAGGKGSDTYRWGSGYGNDTILDVGNVTDIDKLILVNLLSSDVVVSRDGKDLTIKINVSGEILKVQDHFADARNGLNQIVFADNTIWDEAAISAKAWIRGTSAADVLTNSDIGQTLAGGTGSDTYNWNNFGYGFIVENGGLNDVDILKLGSASTSYSFHRVGNDLVIQSSGNFTTTGGLRVKDHFLSVQTGVEAITFTVGNTTWNRERIEAEAWYRGTDGDDTLEIVAGNNRLAGGKGSDTYRWGSGYGNDTILDDGDEVDFDKLLLVNLLSSDVSVSREGYDLLIKINATGERLTVQDHFQSLRKGLNQIVFADNTIWSEADIASSAWIFGTSGADQLSNTDTGQTLAGGSGSDTYNWNNFVRGVIVEDGNAVDTDVLKLGGSQTNYWLSRLGNDLYVQTNGIKSTSLGLLVKDHFLSTQTGIETITFTTGNVSWNRDRIQAEAWYRGTDGDDTLEVISGDNRLAGGKGPDTYRWGTGYGNDIILDEGEATDLDKLVLLGLVASQVTSSRVGHDLVIKINASGETLTVQNQFLSDRFGINQVTFADNSVWDEAAINSSGWIRGTSGNNTLQNTTAGQTLAGGAGSDTYIWKEQANVIIREDGAASDSDRLQLSRAETSYSFTRQGNDLLISTGSYFNSPTNPLVIADHFVSKEKGIESISFTIGSTSWNRDRIEVESWYRGTDGDDVLEVIAGNNRLAGGKGSDIYLWGQGYGNDTFLDNGDVNDVDQLVLVGLLPTDVTVSRAGNDLVVIINVSGERLTVQNHFSSAAFSFEQIIFSDGGIWDAATIATNAWLRATTSSSTIESSAAGQTLAGGAGSNLYVWKEHANVVIRESGAAADRDVLKLSRAEANYKFTRQGQDLLINGLVIKDHFLSMETGIESITFSIGNTTWNRDRIEAEAWYRGGDGNDVMEVVAGNNRLSGGKGSDIYRWGAGYGNDIVRDEGDVSDVDQLVLVGLLASDVTVSRNGADLVIRIDATGETLTAQGHFESPINRIEQVVFADNSVWNVATIEANAWLRGTTGNSTIEATASGQTLAGGAGSNTYVWNRQSNVVIRENGSATDQDRLRLALSETSYSFTRQGNDLLIDGLLIKDHFLSLETGIESVTFTTGNKTWNRDRIEAESWYRGTDGNDILEVVAGNNRLAGGKGSDTYRWGADYGNDVVLDVGDATDVDRLVLVNLMPTDVTVSRVGESLVIRANASGETITVQEHFKFASREIEEIIFADYSVWNSAQIKSNAWLRGNYLESSASGQTLAGTIGTSTYVWNGQNNVVIREQGNATDRDELKLSRAEKDYRFTRQGNDLIVDGRLTVKDHFLSAETGLESIAFATGGTGWGRSLIESEAWTHGTDGDDVLEIIAGNNPLAGGKGSDTYRWGLGYGNDTILEIGEVGDVDKLVLVNLLASDVTASRGGNDLYIVAKASGEALRVQDHFLNVRNKLEQIIFADDTVWDTATMEANAWYRGSSGSNTLVGSSGNDTLFGAGGADTLTGGSGVDKFVIALDGTPDVITDFTPSLGETILFQAESFGLSKDVSVSDYVILNGTPSDNSHGYFIVGPSSVTWDPDGSGAQQAVNVVSFQKPVTGVTAANFGFV